MQILKASPHLTTMQDNTKQAKNHPKIFLNSGVGSFNLCEEEEV